ncbi:sensor histidine kinase [Streptomyces sp. NBC_01445]|uniref:sensor histidine kinase n=1 Tax=Streptomyces sp. NBC_01445 TaxID=2903869 RepID=UPI002DDB8D05|nr:nitrate- and nitrite sensing domain-containing protein [Streptomyces sp. NBC_01445]WSE03462.1 nitrate- and nitrite sensing domain-containing protein [Streptomyces sp. NBC_01445]
MPARLPLPERWRPKSIRAKVVTLLTVPVLSLMALWGHAAVTTASQVSSTEQLRQINSALVKPIADFTTTVQDERAAALKFRAAPGPSARRDFDAAQSRTDKAVAALRAGIRSSSTDLAALDAQLPDRISALLKSAGSLPEQRETPHDSAAVFSGYSTSVDRAFAVRAGLAGADRPDRASNTRTVLELARAREALSRQDAVLGAAQASGTMSAGQYRAFIGDIAQQRGLTKAAVPDLRAEGAARYRAVLASHSATELATAQDAVLDAGEEGAVSAVPAREWHSLAGHTLAGLAAAERGTVDTGADAEPYSLATLGSSGLAVALGLLGVVLSLLLSVRIGRGLVDDLTGLRNSALELAANRLPAAIRRIHGGDDLDLDAEAPLARTPIRDEIGQVGAALTTVQRAALRAVAGRAAVLTGVSGVYVSLARRSQVLLHRQLELLDAMERRTENPSDLEDLFRLDHLTTRMRRHAESLLILSGSAPGRAWRNPVPLIDAVRAGIAETADIDRVQLHDIPDLRLAGTAVADLVHLIAELTENAAAFSPPHTPVVVRGEEVGAGAVLEIEDRGLGMGDEALAAANEKIRTADIDLLDSRRLGLFVVNRLAERQHVDVTLRRSVYGGVTAVVFVPQQLLEAPHPGLRPLPEPEPRASGHIPASDPVAPPLPAQQRPEQELIPRPEREPEPPLTHPAPLQLPTRARHAAPQPTQPSLALTAEATSSDDSEDGLPRRVRQASLAPELRDDENTGTGPQPAQGPAVRSPEAARATMASLRSGRRRASATRSEPGTPSAPGSPSGAPHAAPHPHTATEEGFRNR